MQSKQWTLSVGLGLLLVSAAACSFSMSTANISSLKLGTDKTVSKETTSFSPTDTIYGVAEISNAPGKVKVKGSFIVEDVEGEKSGPVPSLEYGGFARERHSYLHFLAVASRLAQGQI